MATEYSDGGVPCVEVPLYEWETSTDSGWSVTLAWCFTNFGSELASAFYYNAMTTYSTTVSNDYRETTSTSEPEARTTPPEVSRTDSPTTEETGTDRTDIALGGAGKGDGNDGGSGTNIGAIAGGVVGGVVGLALIVLGVWYAGTQYKAKGKEMRELGIGYVDGR
ncbi:uncharacterized protein APUU_60159A [Aspergillus puulaauensis]|uniref:Uncharacterized protein n=1 Tax=Aspergillus puulaauensis TaxID=1220207 RepID=A0A7R7XT63_9EURO|nr:uncharacterized protein APUU_60159A [Aspergillus puulaauensis]BCS27111.1 hypothetical protein APUU_60159A [Aspergillus puulaauensis]